MRLFVAVRPPTRATAQLARALGREPDPRWHVTLAFLGEQPDAGAFDLTEVAAAHRRFELRLQGAGTFHGNVLYAGLAGQTASLALLAEDVQVACRAAGAVLEDRPFRPHLTVARGPHAHVPPALAAYSGPSWPVTHVELVRSVLGRQATHVVLRRFPLGSA